MTVEKYLSVHTFCTLFIVSPSPGAKSSWKDILPMRATESIVVIASADTHIVMTQADTPAGSPNIVKNPPIAPAKIWNGVPSGSTPPEAAEHAITSATTPSSDSMSIAP